MKDSWWSEYENVEEVSVFHVDLRPNLEMEARAFELLDEGEKRRAYNFYSHRGRRNFVLCRGALRSILCERLDCLNFVLQFSYERNEKPQGFIDGKNIPCEFNVSHTADHGLLAFARNGRLGVDVESRNVRHDVDGDIRRVFSKCEQEMLTKAISSSKIDLFLRLWTLKEAVIKATGEGFRADTTAFTIPEFIANGGKSVFVRFANRPDVRWKLVNLESACFAAAFAHEIT